jgi:hypothetical protein
MSWIDSKAEFVMAAVEILNEGVSHADDALSAVTSTRVWA